MQIKSVWPGIGVGSFFWIGDSVREVLLHQGHLISQILNPTIYQVGERLLVIMPLFVLSVIYSSSLGKRSHEIERQSLNLEIHKQLMEQIPKVFWITDAGKNRMIYVSPAYQEIWGRTPESLYQAPRSWIDAIHPDDRNRIIEAAHMKQIRGEYDEEYRIIKTDGSIRWIHECAYPVRDTSGKVYRIAGIAEDITRRKEEVIPQEKEARLNSENQQTQEIIQNIAQGISTGGEKAFFESLIKSLAHSLKMDFGFIGELTGENNQNVKTVAVSARDKSISYFEYPLAGTPCETVVGKKLCIYSKEVARLFPGDPQLREKGVESYIGAPLFDSTGEPLGLITVMDSKPMANPKMAESLMQIFAVRASLELERRRLEEKIQRLEYHDSTTGLPNQLFFYDLLKKGIQKAECNNESLAVLLIDLNRFDEINDTLGFHRGDLLLQEVGKRFENMLGQPGAVARLGGDEFGLILPRATSEEATTFASRILKTLQEPFEIEGLPVCVDAGIGIAFYPDEGKDPDNLILRAEIGLYTSKKAEKTVYGTKRSSGELSDVGIHIQYRSQPLSLVKEARESIESGQLFLVYQPKLDLRTKRVTGVEALIRWRHPKLGVVHPERFIPAAEKADLMKPLTLFILKEAVSQCRLWHYGGQKISVAVNIARQNVLDPDFPAQIGKLLQTCGFNPAWLELEITESMIASDREKIANTIVQIGRMGIGLSLDNFGFLSSSINYLKRLPIHSIKIDRSYVMDAIISSDHAMVVKSAIDFAHDQGLKVIAVGVEDQETMDQLVTFGCDEAQGYFISRPVSAEDLTPWLDKTAPVLI